MPKISSAPSPKSFVETWSADFKAAIEKAAGKDGRLSLNEAKKIAASVTGDAMFADTVERFFTQTGQKSVSVNSIVKDMKAYAQRAAEQASGGDGKISLQDGKKLPDDLRDDFFFLRGKTAPATTPAAGGLTVDQLKTQLAALTKDLLMPSETDVAFAFVNGGNLNGAPITEAVVRQKLATQHDAIIPGLMWMDESENKLSGRALKPDSRTAEQYLQHIINAADPGEPESVKSAQRFEALRNFLTANLTDLQMFRFGDANISTFFVGRAPSGELVGLLTGQVET